MAQWVNFDEVKSQVSIKDVLVHYSLMQGSTEKPTKRGMELRLRCPFHEDKTPSLSINVDTGRFHCFGCKAKGGDILDFVVTKEAIAAGDRTQNRRRAVHLLLTDPEWQAWNNSEIARQCHVSEFLVRTVRHELKPLQETGY
jgi:hypothetical protein